MIKYKINFIYGEDSDINDIFTKVLECEIKKYIKNTCEKNKEELTSNSTYLSLQNKEGQS